MLSRLLQVQKKIKKSANSEFEVLLPWESQASSADYHSFIVCHEQGSYLLDPSLSMATFGIFPFSGLLHVSFLPHLDSASMCCFLISRQKGPAPFFPMTALGTGVPAVGEMQTAKHRSAVQAACSASHRSSWLSTDTGQQLHVPVEIWDETKSSTLLKDVRRLFLTPLAQPMRVKLS